MRAVMPRVPERWLEERARLGADRWDEVWEGVLHIAPAPGREHQQVGTALVLALGPALQARGVQVQYETEVHRPGSQGSDYRIPDLVAFRDGDPGLSLTDRGVEGAARAVVEIRSPDDETYEKLEFYAALGIAEVVVVEPQARAVELYRLAGRRYVAVSPDDQGRLHATSIDARFATVPGSPPRLRVECGGVAADL